MEDEHEMMMEEPIAEGQANLHPASGAGAMGQQPLGPAPLWQVIEMTIRANPHYFLFGAIILYFVLKKLLSIYHNHIDRRPINGPVRSSEQSPLSNTERMARARERQRQLADEASAKDAENRREEERRRLELEKERKRIREGLEGAEGPEAGRTLRGDPAPATGPGANKRNEENGNEEEEDNPKKLPKLPGGDRDTYEPFPSASGGDSGGTCRYRPGGFGRPKKG